MTICTAPQLHVVVASSSLDHPSRLSPAKGSWAPDLVTLIL
jgi:hypothetical protein